MKNNKKINILIASAELNPIAKAGGLGDVVGALPKSLSPVCEVTAIIPFYGFIKTKEFPAELLKKSISVNFNNKIEKAELWKTEVNGIKVLLVKHRFFAGKEIYQGNRVMLKNKYTREAADIEKFAFFSAALLESIKAIDWRPSIIHCNDWHVALVPKLIKEKYGKDRFFSGIKTLFTIHNLANQGISDSGILKSLELEENKSKNVNLMSEGILGADLINTVSPAYAKEILKAEQGAGLDNVLLSRKKDLSGIINGIDVDLFNPFSDKYIKEKYSVKDLKNKEINKLYLQQSVGLTKNSKIAVVGLVSRFVSQKGLDLINDKFSELDCQFVFLGTGQEAVEKQLSALSLKYPGKISVQIKFDLALAQQIYAGSDIFLMPSLFEPCGLGQMIAMRYGTIPVVRSTGGLIDTVDSKVGFSFTKYDSNVLYETLKKALDVYYKKPVVWKKLQINAMKKDFSWKKSALEYIKLYKKLAKVK